MKIREMFKYFSVPVLVASLCCLGPAMLVVLGISTVSFAASLTDSLYGDYKWVFRIVGIVLLGISTFLYLRRKKNICTLDQAKRRRNEIINTIAIAVIVGVLSYIFFLYVVVHYLGVWFGIWQ